MASELGWTELLSSTVSCYPFVTRKSGHFVTLRLLNPETREMYYMCMYVHLPSLPHHQVPYLNVAIKHRRRQQTTVGSAID